VKKSTNTQENGKGGTMILGNAVQTTAGLEPAFSLDDYFPFFLYLGAVLTFAVAALLASQFLFLKPKKDTPTKLMAYESGMDPIGSARMQFDIKFYLIAILFLIFDVELLFLYPWATIAYTDGAGVGWRDLYGKIVFVEILIFLFTLIVAYVYAWRKGVFSWR
jgi:NADH-quinone oxidoreductase subunit A